MPNRYTYNPPFAFRTTGTARVALQAQVHPPVLDARVQEDVVTRNVAQALVEADCVKLGRQRYVVNVPIEGVAVEDLHDRPPGADAIQVVVPSLRT